MASLQIADALPGAILLLGRPDAERGAPAGADVGAGTGPAALLDASNLQDLRLARQNEHRPRSDTVLLTALEELALQDQRGSAPVVGDDKLGHDGVTGALL